MRQLFAGDFNIAKWEVSEPRPIGDNDRSGDFSGIPMEEVRKFPPPQRIGAMSSCITLIGNSDLKEVLGKEFRSPLKDFLRALNSAGIVAVPSTDSTLPDNFVRVVVAPR
jgi:hypothetical protein